MSTRGFPAIDRGDPPVPHTLVARPDEQQAPAIGSPDRISSVNEGRLDPPGLAALRGDNENLSGANGGICIVRRIQPEKGDPLAVRRELGFPSVFYHKPGRGSRSCGLHIDCPSVAL